MPSTKTKKTKRFDKRRITNLTSKSITMERYAALAKQFSDDSPIDSKSGRETCATNLAFGLMARDRLFVKLAKGELTGEESRMVPSLLGQLTKLADKLGVTVHGNTDGEGDL